MAPRARLERATYCLGGTTAPALCRPAPTHLTSDRNSQRQSLSERSWQQGATHAMDYREAALSRMAELPWRVPHVTPTKRGETDRTASHPKRVEPDHLLPWAPAAA